MLIAGGGGGELVIESLSDSLGLGEKLVAKQNGRALRVGNVLAVVANLISRARKLDNFSKQTLSVSEDARQVRHAVLNAVEPDELLYRDLPAALGLPIVEPERPGYPEAKSLAKRVAMAMEELEEALRCLLDRALGMIVGSSSHYATRQDIAEAVEALDEGAIAPEIRPFFLALSNDAYDNDLDWIRALATVLTGKSPSEWNDEDERRFNSVFPQQIAAFQRLAAIYTDLARLDRSPTSNNGSTASHLRVAITSANGQEHNRLVRIENGQRQIVNKTIDSAIEKLSKELGSTDKAQHLLLAALGERTLAGSNGVAQNVGSAGGEHG